MAELKKGDLLKLEFTGTLVASGKVFETTSEAIAKENQIHNPENTYKPRLFFYGMNELLPGIEKRIGEFEVNGEKELDIKSDDAFGKRNPELIRVVPKKEFEKRGHEPAVGMQVDINNAVGTVRAVSGGRVLVDFNHPLAGFDVKYKVKLVDCVTPTYAKIKAVIDELGIGAEVKVEGEIARISFADAKNSEEFVAKKSLMVKIIEKNMEEVKKVETSETYAMERKEANKE